MESIFNTEILLSFLTLSLLEIVLGIDNLVFIAIVVQKLPTSFRKKARFVGLSLALVIRIVMLMGVSWVMRLTNPIVIFGEFGVSAKDMLMLAGGVFLIAKSTLEMHRDLGGEEEQRDIKARNTFVAAVVQISLIDFIFSFDSIITAVGLTLHIPVIVAAIVVSMLVMLLASEYVSRFLNAYPTFKMLALSFILMIGMLLVAEGMHFHVPRGYVYVAFAFSLFVESLNVAMRKKELKRRAHAKAKKAAQGQKH
jgi:predicted tellurium resistance membrane protein TerC